MFALLLLDATAHLNFDDLGLIKQFNIGPLPIRFYSLAYIIGIFSAYAMMRKMIRQPGAPMAERHVDDLLFYAMLGVILGGRMGYVLFYNLEQYLRDPMGIFRLWDGGMSFHGGLLGVTLAMWWCARQAQPRLSFMRMCDYVSCVVPFGMMLGRLANFVNGELWGRATTVSWGIIFPASGTLDPRHPSQLYEAALEGLVLLIILTYAFWRTQARYFPGRLVGIFGLGMGLSRFVIEFFREPDAQRVQIVTATGLSLGQWLTVPMILLGAWLIWSSGGRRQRIEPIAGQNSVA